MAVAASSFVAYLLQRGVHMQFLLWIYPALPYVLVEGARVHPALALLWMLLLDWAHAWVSSVFRPLLLLRAAAVLLQQGDVRLVVAHILDSFGQMRSIADPTQLPAGTAVVRQVGGWYTEEFGWRSIPASFVLFLLLLFASWRLFTVLWRQGLVASRKDKGD